MAASLLSMGLLLAGTRTLAQDAAWPLSAPTSSTNASSEPARVLHFTKRPNAPVIPPPRSQDNKGSSPAAMAPKTGLRSVAYQLPGGGMISRSAEEDQTYQVQLEPPGPLRLFRLESESAMMERMRQEVRERTPPGLPPERLVFPEEPILTRQPYAGRFFPPGNLPVEPAYVCYRRLYFEQKNLERGGWDLGPIQSFLSAGAFYWDLVTLPYHIGTAPCQQFECSAGYCLPGSPVPLLLYPPEISLTGLVLEAGTVTALFAIFP